MRFHSRRLSRVVAVVGLVMSALLTASLATPANAATAIPRGCNTQGHYEVCLTDPDAFSNGQDRTIIDRLRELVQSTNDGDTIRLSMYHWTVTGIADDIVAAHQRGVDVRVVIDQDVEDYDRSDSPYHRMADAGVPMHVCPHSCTESDGHIDHNKFFLFDIDGVRSVVQTSMNLTVKQFTLFNNMVRITGDAALYDYYLAYWNRLNAGSWTYGGNTWTDDDRHHLGDLATKAYVFPRSGDTVLGILDNITACSADGDGDGDGDKKIWVAESLFSTARERVRNRLAQLDNDLGCNVKVVVANNDTETWVQSTTSGGYNLPNDKVRWTHLHHKFIIIDAKYNGRWQETVVTGSHNLTGSSLTANNEAMVRVEDPFVFSQYRHYYDGLFNDRAHN